MKLLCTKFQFLSREGRKGQVAKAGGKKSNMTSNNKVNEVDNVAWLIMFLIIKYLTLLAKNSNKNEQRNESHSKPDMRRIPLHRAHAEETVEFVMSYEII